MSHDIDGAAKAFEDLSLDTYPDENVTKIKTEALRLLKKILSVSCSEVLFHAMLVEDFDVAPVSDDAGLDASSLG